MQTVSQLTTLGQLTDHIRDIERVVAPGSHSGLWGDYCEDMRQHTGSLPYGEYDRDLSVSTDAVEYWLDAYQSLAPS